MKKKVDDRIITLIENGAKTRHRSMFVIIGDKSHDQIVNLHYIRSKSSSVKSKSNILWCYKDKLAISSHQTKRKRQLTKQAQRGLLDPEKVSPLQLFYQSKEIRYCKYVDSETVLGTTYGMCILEDFDALTPNLLARTIETVEGGGLIVLLLRTLTSLTQLYTMAMDVHKRFRTQSHLKTEGHFNERFLLSLASCTACLVVDDELNILPISSHVRSIKPLPVQEDSEGLSNSQHELKMLKEQFTDVDSVGPLITKCCTVDQGVCVVQFLDAILEKTFRNTFALLAARGRGKSAALGLSVAGAVAARYSNIFVTAPSPENLKTFFEFVLVGLKALKYEEHTHYNVVTSSNLELRTATVRVDIFKNGRQTIQYIQPHEHTKLSQVDLLVIDEAAAIPLPVVKSLFGPYMVFVSSTVNGYEGTGRSLSLKLLGHLETLKANGRIFKRVEMNESIRYAPGDPIESWLNDLLCLDVASSIPAITRLPPCNDCGLYYINKETLFSYHTDSELFLKRMMALFVASHYKNSPNDLQLMADAPAHHLFALLGPVDQTKKIHVRDVDILCVIQVSLEGQLSRKFVEKSSREGHQPFGDQIPWKFHEQFRDTVFPGLSGVRIVRIAVHPSATRLGYGSTAIELLTRYYEGQLTSIKESDPEEVEISPVPVAEAALKASLLKETIKPTKDVPRLFEFLSDRKPEKLHYIGVSFGLTLDLFRFWCKLGFNPFYISQIPNAVTGEHSCMILKALENDDSQIGFLSPFYQDFRSRFIGLLGSKFRGMEYKLCVSILYPKGEPTSTPGGHLTSIDGILTPYDLERLKLYTEGKAHYSLVLDLVPKLARLYFEKKLDVSLSSFVQESILLCMGLKEEDVNDIVKEMDLQHNLILVELHKIMNTLRDRISSISSNKKDSVVSPRLQEIERMTPHDISLDDDLDAAAKEVKEEIKTKLKTDTNDNLLNPELLLKEYGISQDDVEFDNALQNLGGKIPTSVQSKRKNKKRNSEQLGALTRDMPLKACRRTKSKFRAK